MSLARILLRRNSCMRLKQLNSLFIAKLGSCSAKYSSAPELEDPKKLTNEDWQKRLSPEQYYVCREKGTEAPFAGLYYNHNEDGIYNCVCCGSELFSSVTKFDSGTGWPSFFESVGTENGNEENSTVLRRADNTHGMTRTEVLCKKCNSHLGHVFDDGPPPTGQRFCINSMCLKFAPKKFK